MGINIAFVSDVRGVLRGTKDVEKAMGDVGDALDDVAKDAKTQGRKVENSLDDVADQATDSARVVERKFRDAFDAVKQEAKRSTGGVADTTKHDMRKAGDNVEEFRGEAKQNFAEVASSFTGDMDGAVDLVQGTLGGLAGSIPGIGIAAGIAAAGIGTIYTVLNAQAETAKRRIEDLTQAMIDANSKVIAEEVISQAMSDIVSGVDGAAISMDNLRQASEDTGVPMATLLRAWAGDSGAVSEALAQIGPAYDRALRSAEGAIAAGTNADMELAQSTQDQLAQVERWQGALEAMQDGWDTAAGRYDLYAAAVAAGEDTNRQAIGETRQAYEDAHRAVGDLSTAITRMPQPVIRPTVDTADAEQRMAAFLQKRRTVTVDVVQRPGVAV